MQAQAGSAGRPSRPTYPPLAPTIRNTAGSDPGLRSCRTPIGRDVRDRAGPQPVHDALDLDLGRPRVHEVELVLLLVRVPAPLAARLEHHRIDAECLDAELAAQLAHGAVAELVDVTDPSVSLIAVASSSGFGAKSTADRHRLGSAERG